MNEGIGKGAREASHSHSFLPSGFRVPSSTIGVRVGTLQEEETEEAARAVGQKATKLALGANLASR
eukprot:1093096-Pyramimonas_sp.AAC.1